MIFEPLSVNQSHTNSQNESLGEDTIEQRQKMIKKRKIIHKQMSVNIKGNTKGNTNCPKFIINGCYYLHKEQILQRCDSQRREMVQEGFQMIKKWKNEGDGDFFNLSDLKTLFGNGLNEKQKRRNYENAKNLYFYLSDNLFSIIQKNTKIHRNILSYMICLEKYTSRLANPQLVHKMQYK